MGNAIVLPWLPLLAHYLTENSAEGESELRTLAQGRQGREAEQCEQCKLFSCTW